MSATRPTFRYYFELATRLYAAMMLSIYGLGKIMGGQFHRFGKIPEEIGLIPLAEVGSFDLAWAFFGYSFGYILFIGTSQLLGSLLLLFERTKLLGVAILLPVLANIIVVDYFFSISTGAMLSAILYTSALGFVIIYNWPTIKKALLTLTQSPQLPTARKYEKWIRLGWAVLIVFVVFLLEQQMLNFVGR